VIIDHRTLAASLVK